MGNLRESGSQPGPGAEGSPEKRGSLPDQVKVRTEGQRRDAGKPGRVREETPEGPAQTPRGSSGTSKQ